MDTHTPAFACAHQRTHIHTDERHEFISLISFLSTLTQTHTNYYVCLGRSTEREFNRFVDFYIFSFFIHFKNCFVSPSHSYNFSFENLVVSFCWASNQCNGQCILSLFVSTLSVSPSLTTLQAFTDLKQQKNAESR